MLKAVQLHLGFDCMMFLTPTWTVMVTLHVVLRSIKLLSYAENIIANMIASDSYIYYNLVMSLYVQ